MNTVDLGTDSIKKFLFEKVILARGFLADTPGYLIGNFSQLPGQNIFVRNAFLTEPFFLSLEDKVSSRYGKEGMEKLYGVGKRHGYRFAELAKLPRSDLDFSVWMSVKFIEGLFADSISMQVDQKRNELRLDTNGLVVTRIGGGGVSCMVSGLAGIWGYFIEDFDGSECGVVKKGEGNYLLICGSESALTEEGIPFFRSKGAPEVEAEMYRQFNKPPGNFPPNAVNFNKLTQNGIITRGSSSLKFLLGNIRLVSFEISFLYDLESVFGDQLIYEVTKESFMLIGKKFPKQADSLAFLADLLTALGYGVATIAKNAGSESFEFSGVPWYPGADKSTFPVMRGAIEGFLEGQSGSKTVARMAKSGIESKSLNVSIGIWA